MRALNFKHCRYQPYINNDRYGPLRRYHSLWFDYIRFDFWGLVETEDKNGCCENGVKMIQKDFRGAMWASIN